MKHIYGSIRAVIGAGAFFTMLASHAIAGCGDVSNLQGPFTMYSPQTMALRVTPSNAALANRLSGGGSSAPSIVGMWNIQLVSMGNASLGIPDGAMIDFGYNQLHSDGTEILNSGGHTPATENFCLGVWGQTGYLTYEVNHFALSYSATTQVLTNYVNIREQITLSPSGDMYTGTFTIDVYDPKGTLDQHITGNIAATRITVDTKPF